jgi:ribose/xylose/arabinose/galactoside ABC-type transport system permease subunit
MPIFESDKPMLGAPPLVTPALERTSPWPALSTLKRYRTFLGFAALILATQMVAPAFLRYDNAGSMLEQLAPLAIVVLGQTLVMMVQGLDLSVSSVMATAAVVAATAFKGRDYEVAAVVGVALAIGVGVGLVNGLLVTQRSVSPFLATLATWTVLEGLRYAYNDGAPSGNVPALLRALGSGKYHGVPNNLLLMTVLVIAVAVLLHRSVFGRKVYLTGGSVAMAKLVGVRTTRTIIACYAMSGGLAAVAGLVLSGYTSVVDNYVGRGFEIDSIVAALIGGVALSGGVGTVFGAVAGAAILILLSNAVLLIGLPIHAQMVIKGAVIIGAAALARRAESSES